MVQMDGGHHDMTGLLTFKLDDTFTKIGLNHLDAMRFEIGIHLTFFCQHRL